MPYHCCTSLTRSFRCDVNAKVATTRAAMRPFQTVLKSPSWPTSTSRRVLETYVGPALNYRDSHPTWRTIRGRTLPTPNRQDSLTSLPENHLANLYPRLAGMNTTAFLPRTSSRFHHAFPGYQMQALRYFGVQYVIRVSRLRKGARLTTSLV